MSLLDNKYVLTAGTGIVIRHFLGSNRLGCLVTGAATMYLLDPDRGNQRRAVLADRIRTFGHDTRDSLARSAQTTRARAAGLVAANRSLVAPDNATDDTVVARVRTALGRAVSDPRQVEVSADGGQVTLSGTVPAGEFHNLMAAAYRARGVKNVVNQLTVYEDGEAAAGQADGGRRVAQFGEQWTPPVRLAAAVGGSVLALKGLLNGGVLGKTLLAAGGVLAARGLSNQPTANLFGGGPSSNGGAPDVQKTLTIHAPIDAVYGFFSNYENWPQFMRNVRRVEQYPDGRSHWVVAGPLGVDVEWDAYLSDLDVNRRIAWESVEGSTVETSGSIRFEPVGDDATRVTIHLNYTPPAGPLGKAVAKLFGADAKTEMDEDLNRVKVMLETGQPARDAVETAS